MVAMRLVVGLQRSVGEGREPSSQESCAPRGLTCVQRGRVSGERPCGGLSPECHGDDHPAMAYAGTGCTPSSSASQADSPRLGLTGRGASPHAWHGADASSSSGDRRDLTATGAGLRGLRGCGGPGPTSGIETAPVCGMPPRNGRILLANLFHHRQSREFRRGCSKLLGLQRGHG
jgi:hypothetical protein